MRRLEDDQIEVPNIPFQEQPKQHAGKCILKWVTMVEHCSLGREKVKSCTTWRPETEAQKQEKGAPATIIPVPQLGKETSLWRRSGKRASSKQQQIHMGNYHFWKVSQASWTFSSGRRAIWSLHNRFSLDKELMLCPCQLLEPRWL